MTDGVGVLGHKVGTVLLPVPSSLCLLCLLKAGSKTARLAEDKEKVLRLLLRLLLVLQRLTVVMSLADRTKMEEEV